MRPVIKMRWHPQVNVAFKLAVDVGNFVDQVDGWLQWRKLAV